MAGGEVYQALEMTEGSPAVVWHTYTMSHHHLSLVAMATTLLLCCYAMVGFFRIILPTSENLLQVFCAKNVCQCCLSHPAIIVPLWGFSVTRFDYTGA